MPTPRKPAKGNTKRRAAPGQGAAARPKKGKLDLGRVASARAGGAGGAGGGGEAGRLPNPRAASRKMPPAPQVAGEKSVKGTQATVPLAPAGKTTQRRESEPEVEPIGIDRRRQFSGTDEP